MACNAYCYGCSHKIYKKLHDYLRSLKFDLFDRLSNVLFLKFNVLDSGGFGHSPVFSLNTNRCISNVFRWKGVNRGYQPLDWVQIERKRHDKVKTHGLNVILLHLPFLITVILLIGYNLQERTLEQQKKLVAGVLKRDQKRRKRIEAAGIDYECPEIVRMQ